MVKRKMDHSVGGVTLWISPYGLYPYCTSSLKNGMVRENKDHILPFINNSFPSKNHFKQKNKS